MGQELLNTSFQEALTPLATRLGRVVREHEVLRLSAALSGVDSVKVTDTARQEVLRWAQKRCGGKLPAEAWNCESFDYLSGGRNSSAVSIKTSDADIWAIRADDPDKEVPERVWTTEVVVAQMPGQQPRFSARLLVSTPEAEMRIEPHVPGFVLQIADKCGLMKSGRELSPTHWTVGGGADADEFIEFLTHSGRTLPVFAISVVPDVNSGQPFVDPAPLARALLGLAVVVELSPDASWELTRQFGKFRSVFGGAIRVYRPGFNEDADPYAHRLVLADQLEDGLKKEQCQRWLRQSAAQDSVRLNPLGKDVLAFSALKAASLTLRQRDLVEVGASDSVQLQAARKTIEALERRVADAVAEQNYFDAEHKAAEERAIHAENQARASALRIQQLVGELKARGLAPDTNVQFPDQWDAFADWCDSKLAGRLVLASSARRGVRNPEFQDVRLAAKCLLWLANVFRESRLGDGGGSLRDAVVEDGYRNSHCGSDEFQFDWQGRRLTADWHVKNNGNTRDPMRCLRIYYSWDPETQQVVVADMPAHRRTGAT